MAIQVPRTLALEPETWFVVLKDGNTLEILAHGYKIEEGHYNFVLLFEGHPNFEATTLRIPEVLVHSTHD